MNMKSAFILTISFLLLAACSNHSKTISEDGGYVIELSFPNGLAQGESAEYIENVFRGRLKNYYPKLQPTITYNNDSNFIRIVLAGITKEDIQPILLLSQGNLEFSKINDVRKVSLILDPLEYANDTFRFIQKTGGYPNIIGFINPRNRKRIEEYLNSERIRNILSDYPISYAAFELPYNNEKYSPPLPEEIQKKIGKSEKIPSSLDGRMGIYLLMKSDENITIDNDRQDNKFTFNKRTKSVDFRLLGEDAEKFARTTRNNIGKPLAVVLDNTVLSAPFISGPIEEGKVSITAFSTDENIINSYLAILNNNSIKSRFEKKHIKYIEPQNLK